MNNNQNNKIINKLLCQHEEWNVWWKFIFNLLNKKNFLEFNNPSGAFVGLALIKCLKEKFNINIRNTSQIVETILNTFNFEKIINTSEYKTGEGSVELIPYEDILGTNSKIKIHYGVKSNSDSNTHRKRSVICHEIGHIFCKLCWEAMELVDLKDKIPKSYELQEQWCWDFSLQLLCSHEKRNEWIETIIKIRDKDEDIIEYNAQNYLNFSYKELSLLAQKEKLSIRATIKSLNSSPLLDELRFGIAIISLARSKRNKENLALRIYQSATPTWGYIISNQRIIWQGFSEAPDIYEQFKDRESRVLKDVLKPQYRLENQKKKYTAVGEIEISTMVEYTAIDTKTEGRFLIAIWNWPTYEEYKEK